MVDTTDRVLAELDLLCRNYPDLEYVPDGRWVRLPNYRIPVEIWSPANVEICFQIPERIPGQQPYGFYVRPGVSLLSREPVGNYAYPAQTGFADDWGKFSWQLESWDPAAELVAGTNMVNFVRSIAERFRQGA